MRERWSSQFWESWVYASPGERIRFHLVRWAPLIAVAILTYLSFPSAHRDRRSGTCGRRDLQARCSRSLRLRSAEVS